MKQNVPALLGAHSLLHFNLDSTKEIHPRRSLPSKTQVLAQLLRLADPFEFLHPLIIRRMFITTVWNIPRVREHLAEEHGAPGCFFIDSRDRNYFHSRLSRLQLLQLG